MLFVGGLIVGFTAFDLPLKSLEWRLVWQALGLWAFERQLTGHWNPMQMLCRRTATVARVELVAREGRSWALNKLIWAARPSGRVGGSVDLHAPHMPQEKILLPGDMRKS